MYNLDINFLRDRNSAQSVDLSRAFVPKKEATLTDKIPIALGAMIFLIAPLVTFSYLKSVNAKTASVKQEIQQLETEIADLGNQNKKIDEANAQIQTVEQETAALVGVFEKIKPWAAIIQEVGDRTPPGVQVDSIQQTSSAPAAPAAPPPAPEPKAGEAAAPPPPTPSPTIGINLAGVARSYDDVNDFVLFLQRSPFFDSKQVILNGASAIDFPVEVANQKDFPDIAALEFPKGIKYTISAQLNNVPSSQLIGEIEKKGAIGLVTRLKTLERKGATLK
jgi:type IV pilus assembly protein PilN